MTKKLEERIEQLVTDLNLRHKNLGEICGLLARKVEELYEIIYDINPEKATVLSVNERRLLDSWKKVGLKKRG